MSLFEFAVASVLVATAMTLGVQVLAAGAAARQAARQRELALVEIGNLAERVRGVGYSVTHEQTAAWIKASPLPASLPSAELSAEVHEAPGAGAAKAVVIECRWRDRRGVEQPPVRVALVLHAPR